jgi:K+-sensing histidine kinase KdpD
LGSHRPRIVARADAQHAGVLAAVVAAGRGVHRGEGRRPGISPVHRQRIFERFYRVDSARSRASGGLGLGLALTRLTVEANGGRVEVESEEGRGSTFRIVPPAPLEAPDQ